LQIPLYDPSFGVAPSEMVSEIDAPGGVTGGTGYSITHFTYDFTNGTRTVSDPRPGIAATTYYLGAYGTVTEIDAPGLNGQANGSITRMTWATPASPQPTHFVVTPGVTDPNAQQGIDIKMVSMIDPLGRETDYTYDALGNIVQQTMSYTAPPGGETLEGVTNANGTAVSSVTTNYTYDPFFNKITSETDPDGNTTFYIYDSPIPLSADSDGPPPPLPPGVHLPTAPGAATGHYTGNLIATIDAAGDMTTYAYAVVTS